MADKKAEEQASIIGSDKYIINKVIFLRHTSRYDPKTNRCYIQLQGHYQRGGRDIVFREVYDGQIDEPLAFAFDENNEKSGMVFDDSHKTTDDKHYGYDAADAYMNEIMTER